MEIAVKREALNAVLEYLANRPWRETNHLIVGLHESRLIEETIPTIEEVTPHAAQD
jgi:hypothetical protein